jgi:16S rRNA (guanine1207-N2)-methyltransferase
VKGHYFSREEPGRSAPQAFSYIFNGKEYNFSTDAGVFSVGKMDKATEILLSHIPPLSGSLLDMGCGYGCIGIILAKEYGLKLCQADINPRALRLTAENAAKNAVQSNIVESDGFSQIQGLFDTVVINPPIHAGKNVIFEMYEGAFKHLRPGPGGSLYVVILKKHGAESSIKRLTEIFGNCRILYKKNGCYVLHSSR